MNVVIFGAGEFAKLMHYYLSVESKGVFNVVGFAVDDAYVQDKKFCGLPIVGMSQVEAKFPSPTHNMLLAIGYSQMRARKKVYEAIRGNGYRLINYIHPSVDKKNLVCGEGNIILTNVTIEPFVTIGNNNIFWSDTLLGHDLIVGSHNYVSAKCLLAGKCRIEDMCFIGNGIIMINSLTIANETYLVAGTNIRKSTKQYGMYAGNPAKLIKFNDAKGIVIK